MLGWEARITRAVGSKEELQELRARIADSSTHHHESIESPREGRTPAVNTALVVVILVVFAAAAVLALIRLVIGPRSSTAPSLPTCC